MEKFCLKWNDFTSNVTRSFQNLRKEEDFFDVTLVGDDGKHVTAHKLVLASSSEYFKTVFTNSKKYFQSHALICLEGLLQDDLNNDNNQKSVGKIIKDVRTTEEPVISVNSPDINSLEELDQKVEESYSKDATGNYACHYCTKSFKHNGHIKEHVEIHFEGLSFPCSLCDSVLRSRKSLRLHKARQHS